MLYKATIVMDVNQAGETSELGFRSQSHRRWASFERVLRAQELAPAVVPGALLRPGHAR